MRIYELGHTIVQKFVPMDDNSSNQLQIEAADWYNKKKAEMQLIVEKNQANIEWNSSNPDKEPKPLQSMNAGHKAIQLLEMWWVRYLIAAAFVFLVPAIKNYLEGKPLGEETEEEDSEEDSMQEFMQYLKFKRKLA